MEPRSTAAAVAEDDALLLPRALFGLCFCLGLMGVLVLDRLLFFFLVPNEVPRLKIKVLELVGDGNNFKIVF